MDVSLRVVLLSAGCRAELTLQSSGSTRIVSQLGILDNRNGRWNASRGRLNLGLGARTAAGGGSPIQSSFPYVERCVQADFEYDVEPYVLSFPKPIAHDACYRSFYRDIERPFWAFKRKARASLQLSRNEGEGR